MSNSKAEPEITEKRTTTRFRYRDYPAEIYSGDALAMARIRAFIDGECAFRGAIEATLDDEASPF